MITVGCSIRHGYENRFPDQSASLSPSASSNNVSPDEISFTGMSVLFEDQSIPTWMTSKIIADYKTLLKWTKPTGTIAISAGTLQINDETLSITHMLDFTAEEIELPSDLADQIGVIAQRDDGQMFLVISKRLSDGYEKAIELMEHHKNAFRSMQDFVDVLNRMDKDALPPVNQLMYFYGSGAEAANAEMKSAANANDAAREIYIEKFIDAFGRYSYALGGILEHQTIDDRPAVRLYVQDKNTEEWSLNIVYVIFDEETWKLLMLMM